MPETLVRSLALLTRHMATRHGSDAALIERYVDANDQSAFAELVRRHGPLVLGVCRRMLGQDHDADDAFQATFLVLARKARRIRKPDAVAAWLYGTATRVCRKALAKRVARPIMARTSKITDPCADLAWKEVCGILDDELSRLPDALRDPLILCYFNGLTRDEAAAKLGWSPRTLMRRLEKGRDRLRFRLARRGVATLGLAAAVISPAGLSARVPQELANAAFRLGAGGTASATVSGLAAGVSTKMMSLVVGFSLVAALCGFTFLNPVRQAPAEADPAHPKTDGPRAEQLKVDADGQKLPAEAVRRLGSRKSRFSGRNDFALPTPDGKHVLLHPHPSLSSYAPQGLVLMDVATGLQVRTFEESRRVGKVQTEEAVRPAAFSPDGKKLYALAWDKSEEKTDHFYVWSYIDNPCKRVVLVWDVENGKLTDEWELPSGSDFGSSLVGLKVSPDGKRVYVYGAITMTTDPERRIVGVPGIHVVDATNGKTLQTWEGAGNPADFLADGKELITFRKGTPITDWDTQTGKPVRTYKLDGFISSVAISPDGKTIAAVSLANDEQKKTIGQIKLWEAATGNELPAPKVDGKTITSWGARILFSSDSKTMLLSAGSGKVLRWDLAKGGSPTTWSAHNSRIADVFVRPGANELVSAGGYDGYVRRWDIATGKALSKTDAYDGEIAVERTPDLKSMVVVDSAGRLDVWDIATGKITKTLQTQGRMNHEILFTPDGKQFILAAQDGPNTIWDWATCKQVGEFAPPPKVDNNKERDYWWGALAFSPDGKHLLGTKFGRGSWMWTWPEMKVLWRNAKELECCSFPDNESFLCADWHHGLDVRDVKTGQIRKTLSKVGAAQIVRSPDPRLLITAHLDGAWRVREASSGAVLKEIKGRQCFWDAAFSPSGWLLAVAGDNSVFVYDTASWQEIARFEGHDGTVKTVFFGPDDSTLVSASPEDGTALVWSLKPTTKPPPPEPAKLWADLAGEGPVIGRAVWAAAQHPDVAIKLFREKWPIEKADDPNRVAKLIADLDSAAFEEREAAKATLEKMGHRVEDELKKAAEETSSAEVKRRIELILARTAGPEVADYKPDEAREFRAVWALEVAATPEAKKLLHEWSAGKVGNRLGMASNAALKRLAQKK
jgi:RNA polymerase sigma factor (sigma-70 family)